MHNIITNTISHRGFITLLALVMSISLYAQNLVKGTVVDETDLPLIGATVLIKGNSGGTITDIDGNYSINAKKGSTIVVSYIGYINPEKPAVPLNKNAAFQKVQNRRVQEKR